MYVSLEVVSPQAASMGADRRRLVGPTGLTIGRAAGNDWVIPDPYISQQHARITFANGAFFVEGLGRNPIAIGRSDNVLPARQPRRLNNGDRLFIDQYEVIVTIQQGEMPGAAIARVSASSGLDDDPFALLEPSVDEPLARRNDPGAAIPERWDQQAILEPMVETATLDPLAVFQEVRQPASVDVTPVNWQQASPLQDHMTLPPVAPSPSQPSGIPENWDRSGFTRLEPPPPDVLEHARPVTPSPARPTPPSTSRPHAERPRPGSGRPAAGPPPAASVARQPIRQALDTVAPPPPTANPRTPAQSAHYASPPASPAHAEAPAAALDFVELLRGAGLTEREMSPETLRELGKALRVVVQGLMEVLHARTEIKSQFRLPLTRVKAAENNPLKLSPNVESALHTLFVQRNAGYLGAAEAFEDAFADLRAHQLAMLEGMRAAFDSMLASFAPTELEARFERGMKRGGLLGGLTGKSRYWELYADRFDELRSDPEDTFRRLFGEVFAEAYEKQLERLRTIARHSARS